MQVSCKRRQTYTRWKWKENVL